ncbi:hypothetical protein C8Q76DRAFT_728553 [Earliella scabrosa]|nr:hypothetical protein C8Q76DRAFT_728553 [Earliella scabrosa]
MSRSKQRSTRKSTVALRRKSAVEDPAPTHQDDAVYGDGRDGEGSGNDDVEDESIIPDPISDIKEGLEDIFEEPLEFDGPFATSRAYDDAPNPFLTVDGLGNIGLPLSIRDAEALKTRGAMETNGVWVVAGKDVTIHNEASWKKFLQEAAQNVCTHLGIQTEPRCELHSLVLCETGSSLPPSAKAPSTDAFIGMDVVLPSQFSGGAVRISYNDLSDVHDSSGTSAMKTTVIGWHYDAAYRMARVTSGLRLVLKFTVGHAQTDRQEIPTMAIDTAVIDSLSRVLLSWKQTRVVPKKIVYLLDEVYERQQLSVLEGEDWKRVALVHMIGRKYGFRVGLASLVLLEKGAAVMTHRGKKRWGDRGYAYYSEDDEFEMEEVHETEFTVERVADLDGEVIKHDLEIDTTSEVIPADVQRELKRRGYESQDMESYGCQTMTRTYRGTALVVWPQHGHFEFMHGSQGFATACDQLQNSKSSSPTAKETELIEFVLANAVPENCAAVVSSVCPVACVWGDASLWLRAVKACDATRAIEHLRVQNLLEAVHTFGFDAVKDCLEDVLQRDSSSTQSLQLLDALAGAVKGKDKKSVATRKWIADWRVRVNVASTPAGAPVAEGVKVAPPIVGQKRAAGTGNQAANGSGSSAVGAPQTKKRRTNTVTS